MSETVGATKSTGAVAPVAGQGPPGRGAAGQTGGGPGGANGAPVAVVDPPAWLASLKPGEAVTGTVRELTADGRAAVDTLRGVLLLDRQAGLDAGRAVRLQVVVSDPGRVELLLLPERLAPRPVAPPRPVALRPGAVVSGHFIPAAGPAAGQAAGQAAGAAAGSDASAAAVAPGAATPRAAAPLAAASSPGAAAAPPAATAVTTGPATTSSSPPGIIIADPPAALRALPSGARLAASVVERLADGRTLLQTEHGRVAVTLPTAMATGAVMRLQVIAAGAPLELAPVEAGAAARTPAGPGTEGRLRARVQTVAQRLGTALGGLAGRAPPAAREAAPLTVRVLAVRAPEAPAAPGIGGAPGRILSGTVTSSAAQGLTVIRTDGGEFVVRTASEVATGSRVVLQVLATPADVLAQSLQNLAHGWPALGEALQALAEGEPQLAAQVTQAALPQTGPQLTTGVLFFLSALFGGRLQDWLGRDALRALERHGPILRRLDEDFGQLARFAKEPVSGEWRAVMLPLMHDGELHQLRLFLRRQRGAAPEKDEAGTRFLLEADFSRLGPLQLDGLVRGRRFDLVVRTTRALPPHMRSDIGEIFAEAGAAANFAGGVTFQVTANFPVAPLDGVAGHALGLFA